MMYYQLIRKWSWRRECQSTLIDRYRIFDFLDQNPLFELRPEICQRGGGPSDRRASRTSDRLKWRRRQPSIPTFAFEPGTVDENWHAAL
jgi:hypothetical protein